jgi:hypothetical protein
VVDVRPKRAGPQRVDVGTALCLGEVNVPPGPLDVPDDRAVGDDALPGPDRRDDVPVLEAGAAGADEHTVGVARVDRRDSVEGRVDGRAVRARDVDPEVDGVACARDPRVAEVATDRVLRMERLERPAVRRTGRGGRCERRDGDRDGDERVTCSGGGHAATVEAGGNSAATALKRPRNAALPATGRGW